MPAKTRPPRRQAEPQPSAIHKRAENAAKKPGFVYRERVVAPGPVVREERRSAGQFPTIAELEKGLTIDRDGLDNSLFEQPDLYYRVSEALTLAISRRDAAYQMLKETMAEAADSVRRDAIAHGDKITDKAVEAEVMLDKGVREIQREHAQYKLLADQYEALKEAFSQRGYVMRELVQLWMAGYFGVDAEKRRNAPMRQRMGDEAAEARARDYRGNR